MFGPSFRLTLFWSAFTLCFGAVVFGSQRERDFFSKRIVAFGTLGPGVDHQQRERRHCRQNPRTTFGSHPKNPPIHGGECLPLMLVVRDQAGERFVQVCGLEIQVITFASQFGHSPPDNFVTCVVAAINRTL